MVLTRKRAREQHTDGDGIAAGAKSSSCAGVDVAGHTEEADEDDGDDEEEVILSEHWSGDVDTQRRRHGPGVLAVVFQRGRYRGRNSFTGGFSHGLRSGAGVWLFDVGSGSESSLSGCFVDDALQGEGRYTLSDGSYTVGSYDAGVLSGEVREYSACHRLLFTGQYRDSQRNGFGVLHHADGGVYSGHWKDGQFHGRDNVYTYPPASCTVFSFRGEWREGSMIACRLLADGQHADSVVYAQDESELGGAIAQQPLLEDRYEQHCCEVRESSLGAEAGEGLFARIDLPPGVVVSFYNGIKQEERITERRHWDANPNAIALDEAAGVDIDVPPPFDRLSHYRASLGHKANHAFSASQQNCRYAHFLHPRFGHIKSIRTRDDRPQGVKAGEELLVDYGYSARGGPRWWKEAKRREREKDRQRTAAALR